jgi:hypothetical protein
MRKIFRFLWVWIILAAGIIVGLRQTLPPDQAVFEEAVGPSFSLSNVMAHLEHIAKSPHPTGWPDNDRVRLYLMEQIRAMGLKPEVQTETVLSSDKGRSTFISGAVIHNVVAKIPGKAPTKTLLLMAHYDSEYYSPGASDNGVGVAVLLETMRSISQSRQLNNDIVFLFTDGEELGLYGARAFWDRHPWANDVGLVLNFEARGTKGASIMFQTSEENGKLIAQLGKMSPHAVASSLSGDIYRMMSNNTDLTIALEKGVPGMNFAFGDGFTRYHTALDNLANVNIESVRHQGLYAYTLANGFGNADLFATKAEDVVYFTLFGNVFYYTHELMYWLSGFIVLLSGLLVWRGMKKRMVTFRGLIASALGMCAIGVLNSFAVYGIWAWLKATVVKETLAGAVLHAGYYHLLFFSVTLCLTLLLWAFIRRKISALEQFFGVLIGWSVVLSVLTFSLPGATYLIAWPLLIDFLLLGFIFYSAGSANKLEHPLMLMLLALPLLALTVPVIRLSLVFLPAEGSAVFLGATGMLLLLLLPCWECVSAYWKMWLPCLGAGVALCMLLFILATNDYSARFPKGDNLFYVYRHDRNEAFWVSKSMPDSWITKYIRAGKPVVLEDIVPNRGNKQMAWIDQAPVQPMIPPSLTVLNDELAEGVRKITLHVDKGQPSTRAIFLQVDNREVLDCEINGIRPIMKERVENIGKWMLRFVGVPERGFDITLRLPGADPVIIRTIGATEGLPAYPGLEEVYRPKDRMPLYEYDGLSMVTNRHEF